MIKDLTISNRGPDISDQGPKGNVFVRITHHQTLTSLKTMLQRYSRVEITDMLHTTFWLLFTLTFSQVEMNRKLGVKRVDDVNVL